MNSSVSKSTISGLPRSASRLSPSLHASGTVSIPVDLPQLPTEFPDYSSQEYWNQRYSRPDEDEESEWYLDFAQIAPILQFIPIMNPNNQAYN